MTQVIGTASPTAPCQLRSAGAPGSWAPLWQRLRRWTLLAAWLLPLGEELLAHLQALFHFACIARAL